VEVGEGFFDGRRVDSNSAQSRRESDHDASAPMAAMGMAARVFRSFRDSARAILAMHAAQHRVARTAGTWACLAMRGTT
jgi:hypothetical protein